MCIRDRSNSPQCGWFLRPCTGQLRLSRCITGLAKSIIVIKRHPGFTPEGNEHATDFTFPAVICLDPSVMKWIARFVPVLVHLNALSQLPPASLMHWLPTPLAQQVNPRICLQAIIRGCDRGSGRVAPSHSSFTSLECFYRFSLPGLLLGQDVGVGFRTLRPVSYTHLRAHETVLESRMPSSA